ncbi:MAG: prepilin-type N-terminal cleavage/methylation domain-containing protein [Oligoflexales bacterium]|nr:prepilin-type N-terminal cleavage/methylation domain-containing protein [Oligoflexales bacterium]
MKSELLKSNRAKNEQGFSLLSVIVAIGLAGILVMIVNNVLNQQRKMMTQIKYQGEREELRADLKNRVYCIGASCENVKESLPPKIGSWKIRGDCDEEGLNVKVRRYDRFGKPSRHPLKKGLMKWQDLYNTNDGYLCKFNYSDSLEEASEVDNRREYEDHTPRAYERVPEQQLRTGLSDRKQLEQILNQEIDERELQKAVNRAKQMLQTMCPEGQTLEAIDTETMQVVCR